MFHASKLRPIHLNLNVVNAPKKAGKIKFINQTAVIVKETPSLLFVTWAKRTKATCHLIPNSRNVIVGMADNNKNKTEMQITTSKKVTSTPVKIKSK